MKHSLYLARQAALADDQPSLTAQDIIEQRNRIWKPFEGQQEAFINYKGREALFGGQAGPGKTECLVMDFLDQIWHPRYNAIIFRRTFKDLEKPDGAMMRSKLYYPQMGGVFTKGEGLWSFPSGATISFGGLEYRDDVRKYQSSQFQAIGFDELTHFEEFQYLYMFSRLREPYDNSGLYLKMRGATNPGGIGHYWVKERFVTQDIEFNEGHFALIENEHVRVDSNHPNAYERRFFRATRADNPALDKKYEHNLDMLPEIERKRLKEGDWDAEYKDTIWQNFTSKNISSQATYDPAYPVYWSIDDGTRNPRAILFIQERPILGVTDAIVVFDEYYQSGELAAQAIDNVLEYDYDEPELVIHDPSAAALQAEIWINYGFMTKGGDNDVPEGIKTVRRLFGENEQACYLFIHPNCKNLIRELQQYRYDEKSKITKGGDPKPIKENDHACDALRYYCHTMAKFKAYE